MLRDMLLGTAAGAVGTVALNAATYADVLIRGRAPSELPAKMAGRVASDLGISLTSDGDGSNGEAAQHRRTGLGALMGYAVGLGIGSGYGVVRPLLGSAPLPLVAVGLGLGAMAASDVPLVQRGLTDPAEWGASGWAADVLPHLAYGMATAIAYDAFARR